MKATVWFEFPIRTPQIESKVIKIEQWSWWKEFYPLKCLDLNLENKLFLVKQSIKNHRMSLTCLQNVEHSPLAHELNDFGQLNVKGNNYTIILYKLLLYTST